jgi:hypothetical protein
VSAVLVLLAVLLLGACSSPAVDSSTPSASPTLQGAGRFADPVELGTALQDAALTAGSAQGDLVASSADGRVDGGLAYEFATDDVAISAEVSVSGPISADLGVVLADGTVYLRVPTLYQLFTSAPWVRAPTGAGSDLSDQVDGLVEALAAEVPGTSLVDLDDPSSTLTFLGSDSIDGVAVELYEARATVDGVEIERTYWVDDDDLLRRLDSIARDPAQSIPATSRHTYTDWGEPVSVEVPDPADVTDFPEGLL